MKRTGKRFMQETYGTDYVKVAAGKVLLNRSYLPGDVGDQFRNQAASDDLRNATIVEKCALSPTDTDAAASFSFPRQTQDGAATLASVDLTVMKNGDLSVADGEIVGWTVDANGDWISQ